jgi:hypothetical protein
MKSTGKCLCGAIHYSLSGKAILVLECHCSMCRRESGAASLVYAKYRRADVSIAGQRKFYRASEIAKRGFCPNCGSPMSYEDVDNPECIWLTAGTHDEAETLPPREHVYVHDKLPWVEISKHLRQWPRERLALE